MILSRRSSDDLGISLKQSSYLHSYRPTPINSIHIERVSVRLVNTTLSVLRYARIAAEVLQQIICTIKIGCTPTRHDNNGYSRIISVPTILSTVEKYLSKSLICEV